MSDTDQQQENVTQPSEGVAVRKIYVSDVNEGEQVRTVFRVGEKKTHVGRRGQPWLAFELLDRTGRLDARIFEGAGELDATFNRDDYVYVEGEVIQFRGKPQLVVKTLERLDPEPLDAAEFEPPAETPSESPPAASTSGAPTTPASKASSSKEGTASGGETGGGASEGASRPTSDSSEKGAGAVAAIRLLVERVEDTHVRALLLAFLDDPKLQSRLDRAPAAKEVHHAYPGGLAKHLLSVMRLAHRIADHYPMADRDLLLAGAFLHDVHKAVELSGSGKRIDYTEEGRLVGHIVMTAQAIREKASRIDGFPPLLEQHLTHLVLAHHGRLEYGSPKAPVTLEALLVHAIDNLDAQVHAFLDAVRRDGGGGLWTDRDPRFGRRLWKGAAPTERGKARRPKKRGAKAAKGPREGREDTPEGTSGAGATREGPPRAPRERKRPERDARPGREERTPRGRQKEEAPSGLTFKPLSELAAKLGTTDAAAPAAPEPTTPVTQAPETAAPVAQAPAAHAPATQAPETAAPTADTGSGSDGDT